MKLDEECKGCLYRSQLKKVEREQGAGEKLEKFKAEVKKLCDNPPATYSAPLLMRDIDGLHRKIFAKGIDYSKEKTLFNNKLLALESELYAKIIACADPVAEAMKYAMAANYIDFAKLPDLNAGAVDIVLAAAQRANPDERALALLKDKLKRAKTLLYLHDNCGEIVLDKILIRVIKAIYPQINVTSVVRGGDIINDVTENDAREVGLYGVAKVINNGSNVAGTYLKEASGEVLNLLEKSDVIISKGLGNLETLYGEGYSVFYCFTCKCEHISKQFNASLMSAVLAYENSTYHC